VLVRRRDADGLDAVDREVERARARRAALRGVVRASCTSGGAEPRSGVARPRERDERGSFGAIGPTWRVARGPSRCRRRRSFQGDRARASTPAPRGIGPDRPRRSRARRGSRGRARRNRGSAPPEVQEARTRREELPVSLALVPPAIDALQAIERHDGAQARAALDKAIRLANSPSVAAWLGTLALEMDDEATARQAALAAVQF